MKKIFFVLCCLLLYTPLINAEENVFLVTKTGCELTEEQYYNLLGLGFDDEEINKMSSEEIDYNKNIGASLISEDTVYSKIIYTYSNNGLLSKSTRAILSDNIIDDSEFENLKLVKVEEYEISEEEYNNLEEISQYSTNAEHIVETTGKKLKTTISYISSSNRYRFKNTLTWKKMPKNRYNELFGIIYDEPNANTVVGSQKAYYYYTVENNCYYTCEDFSINYSNTKYWNTKNKSYYMSFPLKADESITYKWDAPSLGNPGGKCPCQDPPAIGNSVTRSNEVIAMSATMYYDILKSTSTKVKALTVAGEYQHAYKKLSLNTSLSFDIKTGGLSISIDPEYKTYYDGMKNTNVQLTGINW